MSKTGKLCVAILGMGLLATCHQTIFTAPPGSEIVALIANPLFIPSNGGVSEITAVVYDATGQPVPDGTVVQFFTDLGRVDPQGKSNDGVVKVNLRSDGRSGEAEVTAVIGGGSAPTPTPTPTASAAASVNGAGSAGVALGSSGSASSSRTQSLRTVATEVATVTVTIGTELPKRIFLSADPRNIGNDGPRFSTLTATVFDERGNPVANIPVVFRIILRSDPDFTESLESRGRPVFTDTNGQAKDRLFTTLERGGRTAQVDVQAATASSTGEIASEVTVGINF